MSSIYMDVLKDRMYCDAADSLSRRSAQTAMYKILDCLVRMLAPILVHTAEEVWEIDESELTSDERRNTKTAYILLKCRKSMTRLTGRRMNRSGRS